MQRALHKHHHLQFRHGSQYLMLQISDKNKKFIKILVFILSMGCLRQKYTVIRLPKSLMLYLYTSIKFLLNNNNNESLLFSRCMKTIKMK